MAALKSGSWAFWRDVRVVRIAVQLLFLVAVALGLYWLFGNYVQNTKRLSFGFDFLGSAAGFTVSEGLAHERGDPNWKLFLVGVLNSLRVILIGIVLASLLGLIAGVARISHNWLVSRIATVYIETIRNTPLLVQLFFWYSAVYLKLPLVRESITLPGHIFLNNRGLILPEPYFTQGAEVWRWFLLAGIFIGLVAYVARRVHLARRERPGFPFLWGFGAFVGLAVLGYWLAPQRPIAWEVAELKGFNFEGGLHLSPEFAAVLTGLVVYTAAFIAEIVRAGILAVSKGQKEAALALGLTGLQTLQLVVLPQALRVIVPPVTSQYLNLAKNSSLAAAIAYPDLFNVAITIVNKTGREVEMILIIMGSYLSLSLLTSLFMNWYNRRIRLVER